MRLTDRVAKLEKQVAQLCAERDYMINDTITEDDGPLPKCFVCKHFKDGPIKLFCIDCGAEKGFPNFEVFSNE